MLCCLLRARHRYDSDCRALSHSVSSLSPSRPGRCCCSESWQAHCLTMLRTHQHNPDCKHTGRLLSVSKHITKSFYCVLLITFQQFTDVFKDCIINVFDLSHYQLIELVSMTVSRQKRSTFGPARQKYFHSIASGNI